jgi:hypothetical protein
VAILDLKIHSAEPAAAFKAGIRSKSANRTSPRFNPVFFQLRRVAPCFWGCFT